MGILSVNKAIWGYPLLHKSHMGIPVATQEPYGDALHNTRAILGFPPLQYNDWWECIAQYKDQTEMPFQCKGHRDIPFTTDEPHKGIFNNAKATWKCSLQYKGNIEMFIIIQRQYGNVHYNTKATRKCSLQHKGNMEMLIITHGLHGYSITTQRQQWDSI